MTTQDTTSCRPARSARAALCLAAIVCLAVITTGSADRSAAQPSVDSPGIETARSPLLPKKTRHIIRFHRWGLA